MNKPTMEIPCYCGDTHARWRDGLLSGQRIYCCDKCWKEISTPRSNAELSEISKEAAKYGS